MLGAHTAPAAFDLAFLSELPYLPGYVASELHYHPELAPQVLGERGVPLEKLRVQLEAEAAAGAIRPIAPEQFVANLMASPSLALTLFAAGAILLAVNRSSRRSV